MFANASKVKDTGQRSNHEHTWQTKAASMLRLSDLQEVDNKVSVLLLVIVSTAPSRYKRREAIRETWWKKCDGIEVQCKFFTDGLQLSKEQERQLSTEQRTHRDIEFQALENDPGLKVVLLVLCGKFSTTYKPKRFTHQRR
ncbi:hypothetical protein ACROYT_G043083 [Oculina patagonica]